MLAINNKNISRIALNNKFISRLNKGVKIVYQAVRSCFGSGWWREERAWLGDDAWKN